MIAIVLATDVLPNSSRPPCRTVVLMKLQAFMTTFCASERGAAEHLLAMGVFSADMMSVDEQCDKPMTRDFYRLGWRCYSTDCGKELPIQRENSFFQYKESSGRGHARLNLNHILELHEVTKRNMIHGNHFS